MGIGVDLALDFGRSASRGAAMMEALRAGVEASAARREERRQAGVVSVQVLADCLRDARKTEGQAIAVAQTLEAENAELRSELQAMWEALQASSDRAARAEAAVIEAAKVARARRLHA